AHPDLHPCLARALAVHRQCAPDGPLFPFPPSAALETEAPRAEPLAEMGDRSWAERDVDLRVEREDALALRLGVAAPNGDDRVGMLALARAGVAEIRSELRVRLLPDGAGVDDDDVGVLGCRRLTEAELLEHALDALRIVSVHLAAERGHVVPAHLRRVAGPWAPKPPSRSHLRSRPRR